jgi:hypothetical protein
MVECFGVCFCTSGSDTGFSAVDAVNAAAEKAPETVAKWGQKVVRDPVHKFRHFVRITNRNG